MKKFKNSIIFKLLFSVILIFIIMTAASNYIIGRYQEKMIFELGENFTLEREAHSDNESFLVIVEDAKLKSTKEMRRFSLIVIISTIIIGSLIYLYIIYRILNPLRELKNKALQIDIDNLKSFDSIYMEGESSEIEELSRAFQNSIDKIYSGYEREKSLSRSIAHELNTPVTIMKSEIDLYKMKDDLDKDSIKYILNSFDENIDRISNIIESLLFLNSRENLRLTEFDIAYLIDEIVFDLEDIENDKKVLIKSNVKSKVIKSNDILIQRMLYNIGKNAVLYNVENGIVEFYFSEIDNKFIFEVKDTGIGLSDEDKKKVFDLFYRVDSSRSRKTGGYGIGLNLTKNIVKKLEGDIEILDNHPQGIIVKIILPKN